LLYVGGKITLNFGRLFKVHPHLRNRVVSVGNLNTYLFMPNGQLELFLGGVDWGGLEGGGFSPLFSPFQRGMAGVLRGWGGFFYAF
jgi:hypothetical protein